MTDRFHSLTVVLEKHIGSDEADAIINAIRCMRNVLDVRGNVADAESYVAESKARLDAYTELQAALRKFIERR